MQNSLVYGGEIKEESVKGNIVKPTLIKEKSLSSRFNTTYFMQIMHDVFLSSERWLKDNQIKAVKMGITHVIIEERYSS